MPDHAVLRKSVKYMLVRGDIESDDFWQKRLVEKSMAALCYHRVCDESNDPYDLVVHPRDFEMQMQVLSEHALLRPVGIQEYEDILYERRPYPEAVPVLVSFDDGYRDNVLIAAPILKKCRVPAIMYVASGVLDGLSLWYDVIADFVERGRSIDLEGCSSIHGQDSAGRSVEHINSLKGQQLADAIAELQELGKDQITEERYVDEEYLRKWVKLGFDVGAHTVNHPRLPNLPQAEAEAEILNSVERLESFLDYSITSFAYPFGSRLDFTEDLESGLARSSLRSAFTTVPGLNTPSSELFRLRRRCVANGQFRRLGRRFCETLFLADLLGRSPATISLGSRMGNRVQPAETMNER